MSTCVIVFKEKEAAKELLIKLRGTQTPFLKCDFIEPLNNKMESETINLDRSEQVFINQLNFNNVKLLNPSLARKGRQKTLATWLIPFGFIAGLSFSQMTDLQTFAEMGFPNQFEKLIGGLVGMISGWLGSFFAAGNINQENNENYIESLIQIQEQYEVLRPLNVIINSQMFHCIFPSYFIDKCSIFI